MSGIVNLDLPWPPSVNAYWRAMVIKGRPTNILSRRGREFQKLAAEYCLVQKLNTLGLTGRLQVEITAFPPDRRARDLDNLLKPSLDALEHANVYRNDSQIDLLTITRGPIVKNGRLTIRIQTLSEVLRQTEMDVEAPAF